MKHDLETEQRILAAARKVFQSKGMHGARMQDIADTAGINKALLHYYFRNKEQLFESVFMEAIQKFLPALFELWKSDLPFEKKLTQFIHGYMDLLLANPFLPAFILHEINQNPQRLQSILLKKGAGKAIKNIFGQVQNEMKRRGTKAFDPRQMIVNTLALCVFPFAAKPLITKLMGMKDKEFHDFIQQRKEMIPQLILQSIKSK